MEIKGIIEQNAVEGRDHNDWENVGFQTDDGVTWVDRYRLRNSITIVNQDDKLLGAVELCKEINKQRSKYLEPLRKLNTEKMMASQK